MTNYKTIDGLLEKTVISMHKNHLKRRMQETLELLEKKDETRDDYLSILKDLMAGYSSLIHCMQTFYNPKNT